MGYRVYDDNELLRRKKSIADSGGDTFARTTAMRNTRRAEDIKVHEKLSIAESYRGIRECRDSETHPESNAIAAIFDVTGSQGEVPKELEANLKDLMGLLLKNNYLPDAEVLFGAVGDSTSDRVPLQIGQFEPGAEELMNFFQRVFLEGMGGGQGTESYQNAFYFMARHTELDSFEKRGKKGYLFMTGDELPYNQVRPEEIKKLMGGAGPEAPIPTTQIIKEVKEKYVVFFIIPLLTSGGRDPRVWSTWQSLLGKEYVLGMEQTDQISELIGTTVGVAEGKLSVEDAMKNLRKKNFGEKYLGIARDSYLAVYGVNKKSKKVAETPPGKSAKTKQPSGEKKDDGDKKKPLKI